MAAGLFFFSILAALTFKQNHDWLLLSASLFGLIINLVYVGGCFVPAAASDVSASVPASVASAVSSASAVPTGGALKLLQFNLNSSNDKYGKFYDFVERLKPDVICLEEYGNGWFENLSLSKSAIKTDYPFQISNIRNDNFGIAIFSRYPLKDASIQILGEDHLPSAFARVQVNGTTWSIMATHPPPPLSTELYDLRNQQFVAMADFIKKQSGNFVLSGDLNSAPWSAHFSNFLQSAGLKDSRTGFGLQASWPSNCWILRIPIDHILTSKNIVTKVRRIEEDLGSDHLPVYAELISRP